MKHYSAADLSRLALVPEPLHEHDDVVAHVRGLVIADGKAAVARRLGLREERLTKILRGRCAMPDRALAALGYRRVVRFEMLAPAAPHTNPAARARSSERTS